MCASTWVANPSCVMKVNLFFDGKRVPKRLPEAPSTDLDIFG